MCYWKLFSLTNDLLPCYAKSFCLRNVNGCPQDILGHYISLWIYFINVDLLPMYVHVFKTDFKEWKLVIQEIVKFLKVDTSFINNRPLRYSTVLDLQPDSLPVVLEAKKSLKPRDALLCSYHPNEVKFSELTLNTFRMLQCLEWEPGGSFYQLSLATSTGSGPGTGQNGAPGPSRVNKDITDPTLPPNLRKAILYRPAVTHFMAVLGTVYEELASDGVLLIYISASESSIYSISSPTHAGSIGYSENISRGFQFHPTNFEPTSSHHLRTGLYNADHSGHGVDCLHIGPRGHGVI